MHVPGLHGAILIQEAVHVVAVALGAQVVHMQGAGEQALEVGDVAVLIVGVAVAVHVGGLHALKVGFQLGQGGGHVHAQLLQPVGADGGDAAGGEGLMAGQRPHVALGVLAGDPGLVGDHGHNVGQVGIQHFLGVGLDGAVGRVVGPHAAAGGQVQGVELLGAGDHDVHLFIPGVFRHDDDLEVNAGLLLDQRLDLVVLCLVLLVGVGPDHEARGFGLLRGEGCGGQAQQHRDGENQGDQFLHDDILLTSIFRATRPG